MNFILISFCLLMIYASIEEQVVDRKSKSNKKQKPKSEKSKLIQELIEELNKSD